MIVFSYDFPPVDGGISRLCAGIAMELHRNSIGITVLTHKEPVDNQPRILKVQSVPKLRIIRELLSLLLLRRLKRRDKVILCGIWYPEALIALFAGYKNIIALAHGNELMPYDKGWRKLFWNPLRHWVLNKVSCVIGDSDYSAELVRRLAPEARVISLPLPVDHTYFIPGSQAVGRERFGLEKDAFIIGSVSRLVRYKGHELVFEALAALSPEMQKKIRYTIAGKGPDENYLRQRAKALRIDSSVKWIGFINDSELPSFYQALDLFALCTREDPAAQAVEGFGLVFLEAQACGIPAVGTRTGGISNAIDEKSGFLVDQNDKNGLAAILIDLSDNRAKAQQLGHAARRRVESDCTWEGYAQKMLSAIKRFVPENIG